MNDKIIEQITAHAARDFPREACGLVINTGTGYYALECENQSHDPEHSFLIDPLVYHQHRDRIGCVYHSHPNRQAKPSEADIASSERCAVPFLIISYPSGELYTYTPRGGLPAPYEGRYFVYGVMDCLSLVTDYYHHEMGIKINEGSRKSQDWWLDKANGNAFLNGFLAEGFEIVGEPQKNDVIIMALRQQGADGAAIANHAALYMGDNVILHHPSREAQSRQEMYGHYWRSNTVCILRYSNENH